MIAALLIPVLAFAFARAPSAQCRMDAECVLVRNTHCGDFSAIVYGQDEAWAKWDAKQAEQARAEKRVCAAGSRMDPRLFEAWCERGQCAVRPKAPQAETAPTPPKSGPSRR